MRLASRPTRVGRCLVAARRALAAIRYKDELFALVNAKEQCIKPMCARNVTANDKLLLSVRTVLYPCSRSLAGFVDRTDSLADNPFQIKLAHGLKNGPPVPAKPSPPAPSLTVSSNTPKRSASFFSSIAPTRATGHG